MSTIQTTILNGAGTLMLNESFLVDMSAPAGVVIPTADGKGFQIFFEFHLVEGLLQTPNVELSKIDAHNLSFKCNFSSSVASYLASTSWLDIEIAGRPYKFLFLANRIRDKLVRIEISLYEVDHD